MIFAKTVACAALALSFAAPIATAAHAEDAMMKKDETKKDSMMKHDGMMKRDGMRKDGMMKHDGMAKSDAMKKDSSEQ